MRDYYAVLGLGKSASASEVKRAFRKLARKWHPDVNDDEDAAERFKEVAEAYATLGNQVKRRAYDASRSRIATAFMDELFESGGCKTCPTCGGTGMVRDGEPRTLDT